MNYLSRSLFSLSLIGALVTGGPAIGGSGSEYPQALAVPYCFPDTNEARPDFTEEAKSVGLCALRSAGCLEATQELVAEEGPHGDFKRYNTVWKQRPWCPASIVR